MRYYFIIILCMGLNACVKRNMVKPEVAPPPPIGLYIEKFQSGEEPEQWGIFTNGQADDDLEKMLEHMKSDPIYSNQIMKTMNAL